MRAEWFIGVLLVVFAIFAGICLAVDNPVGTGRVPASSDTSGLVKSPNPLDSSKNLVITGNVGGGKHFRGIVPYNAISDFAAPLGSTLLDPFLRRSVDSTGYSFTGSPASYFSQTSTVTGTIPGSAGIIRQPTLSGETQQRGIYVFPSLPKEKVYLEPSKDVLDIRFRPLSMTIRQMEPMLSSDVERYLKKQREMTSEQEEQLQRDLEKLTVKAEELKKPLIEQEDSLRQMPKLELGTDIDVPLKSVNPIEEAEKNRQADVYDQMQKRIDDLKKGLDQPTAAGKPKEAVKDEKKKGEKSSALEGLSAAKLSVKAQTILGEHKTFASFSEDKFNQYMGAGEECLKQGKYYMAANAYTIASIYKPSDPLAYAGKSHALFAAGEYMSSALFLSRALEIFPGYARFKIDIIGMIGSKDVVEARIADIEQLQKEKKIGELQFLLGYIYYQIGRPELAREAIDTAYEKMPDSAAVASLKQAIYDTTGQ